ncbi:hypothetical protein [Hyalangium versicolor]|uniref:hypothetical protein n=1 Tax=Hyalangium versicolor TaxID=2861190 RepID=UPI001CCC0EB1|nr:hypothetical protein [Hyalangium versicolor]
MDALLSFRPVLSEKMMPLARPLGADVEAATEILVEAVVQVSNFKEEGFPLAPLVFVGRELKELLEGTNGSSPIELGSGPCTMQTVRVALKSCAPLAEGRQWAIYLLIREGQLRFGIFCTDRSPLRFTSFEAIRLLPEDGPPLVGITQLGESVVEVRGSAGAHLYFDFSGSVDLASNPMRVIKSFVHSVTRDVKEDLRPRLKAFYYRLGVDVISGGHGALVAVLDHRQHPPDLLMDGIWLGEPIDLGERALRYEAHHSEADALALVAYGSLFRRMVGMDGITVFGSDGRLLGYNCFIHQQIIGSPTRQVVGGARRRAFEVLCRELGRSIAAVLYRSRDGAAECRLAVEPEWR